MKIVHLNTERTWRGGERQTFWLARELHLRGHASLVACRPGFPLDQACRREGIPSIPFRPFMEGDAWACLGLRRFLLSGRVDVLHAHTGHGVGLGALAAWGTPVKFLATRRVDFPIRHNIFSRLKHGRLDFFVAISQKVQGVLLGCGIAPSRIELIPSGLDVSCYPHTADRAAYRAGRGFGAEDLLIVNVGALVWHKGQSILLEAVSRVLQSAPRALFLFLGDGVMAEELKTMTRRLGVEKNVRFLGHRSDVLEYIAMADLFVFPSVSEGLGTSVMDALAIGVPTVAARAGGIPEIYGSNEAPELVAPSDPLALAEGILKVLKDPAESARRVERGRKTVERFTVKAMTDR